ncbi:MAG: ribose 5-phosphate isomerase B [Heliobacteriaceae bacterium]|nr:ribose 5-phosphate isomerase B [Heliobacteriaceae bacterium]
MKIAIAGDHGGYRLKEEIKAYFAEEAVAGSTLGQAVVTDLGAFGDKPVDYPDFGAKVGRAVARGEYDFGIVICGTGIGIAIAANKIRGVRAALCHDPFSARMAREHNDANVLALGERVVGPGLAKAVVAAFFTTPFAGGRHTRRLAKLLALEQED